MTTIAYKDGVIAADSRMSFQYRDVSTTHNVKKIWKGTGGRVYGMAGVFPEQYFFDQLKKEDFSFWRETPNLDILEASKDGIFLRQSKSRFKPILIPCKFFALGSGCQFAMGAMAHGANARQAVEASRKIDIYTGGKIHTIRCTE